MHTYKVKKGAQNMNGMKNINILFTRIIICTKFLLTGRPPGIMSPAIFGAFPGIIRQIVKYPRN